MSFYSILITTFAIYNCLLPAFCSYLGYPRIHFAGQYRVDTNGVNNERCNFRPDRELVARNEPIFHNFGSNSFHFLDATVTSVVFENGTRSTNDPIVGKSIVSNVDRPYAKLTDLDVDCQQHSTVYGMDFGIGGDSNFLFYGNWTPSVISQSLWPRIACFTDKDECRLDYSPGGESFSGQSTSTLTNIEWNLEPSDFLAELKDILDRSGHEGLAVRLTQYAFQYTGVRAGLGLVVGVMGVPSDSDTLNVPGERVMVTTMKDPIGLQYDLCEECKYNEAKVNQGQIWMSSAPFEVDEANRILHVDLSLSLVVDNNLQIRDIGNLQLGIYYESLECVELIGEEFEYTNDDEYRIYSAIYDVPLDSDELLHDLLENPLVVAQVVDGSRGEHTICSDVSLHRKGHRDSIMILLKEVQYYVRPRGYYVGRFEQTDEYPVRNVQEVYITKYGRAAINVNPTVTPVLNPFLQLGPGQPEIPSLPLNGVQVELMEYDGTTGIAKFEYKRNEDFSIPEMRQYVTQVCYRFDNDTTTILPIDGQVYFFQYGLEGIDSFDPTQTVFLTHSTVHFTPPYTWVKDVSPILAQFALVSPIMNTILDLSDYNDVTKPHNIDIMKRALRLDFNDPSYMPSTRDLSPAKRDMILEWLEYPLYEDTCKLPTVISRSARRDDSIDIPGSRCVKQLPYNEYPDTKDDGLISFYRAKEGSQCSPENIARSSSAVPIPGRPLFRGDKKGRSMCSRANIIAQLQTALQLEWATIPVYLTSLYSIADGCNVEIYNLIRSTVMQEMLHFALVGNMLIALGEEPIIDSPDITPSYPGSLPGCVVPELDVTLEQLSRQHIHDVFMVIELPVETEVGGSLNYSDILTIGVFYNEIKTCLQNRLDVGQEEIFDALTADYQVKWPAWGSNSIVGNLIPILNTSSAIEAINVIVSQGEGATMLSPKDIDDATLAHFFRFEQIYCQHRLKKEDDDSYSYSGYPIHFNADGILNMRPNPTTDFVAANSLCYTESRIFHQAYRNFLRQLQKAFRGRPSDGETRNTDDDFFTAVTLMEALQLNAKRLMRIEFDEHSHTTCGPVWDYEWRGV